MVNLKLVVSEPKTRRAFQKELDQAPLLGKKLGETLSGDSVGLHGYELQITGGSDKEGFPMRMDMPGIARKRALLSGGVGFRPLRKGQRKRKSVRGNTISESIVQVNAKVTKDGAKPIHELWGVQLKEPKKKGEAAPATEEKK